VSLRDILSSYHYDHEKYRRNLPHFQPDGATLFITFRLHGTLPLHSGRDGRAFVVADRALEHDKMGPVWLRQQRRSTAKDGPAVPAR